jgi:hypothetical protein
VKKKLWKKELVLFSPFQLLIFTKNNYTVNRAWVSFVIFPSLQQKMKIMKKLFLSSVILLLFSITIIIFQLSCKKEVMAKNSSTNTILTKTQILIKNKWQVQEVMSNYNCSNLHFIDGSINTTGVDYSKFQLTFKIDSTGTYKDESGKTYTTKWKFVTADEHNMECKVFYNNLQVTTFNWAMIEISDSSFQSISAVSVGANNILQSTRYVSVP